MSKSRIALLLTVIGVALLGAWWLASFYSEPEVAVESSPILLESQSEETSASAEWIASFQQQMAVYAEQAAISKQLFNDAQIEMPHDEQWAQQYVEFTELNAQVNRNEVKDDAPLKEAVALLQTHIEYITAQNHDLSQMQHAKNQAQAQSKQWQQLVQSAQLTSVDNLNETHELLNNKAEQLASQLAFVAAGEQWQQLAQSLSASVALAQKGVNARAQAQTARKKWRSIEGAKPSEKSRQAAALFATANEQLNQLTEDAGLAAFSQSADAWEAAWHDALVTIATPHMIAVSSGSFRMGDIEGDGKRDQLPVHQVDVSSFKMAVTQVTFKQFSAYTVLTQQILPDSNGWGEDQRPVINVTWQQANDYAVWLSEQTGRKFRLPSEAEWEYAARAGSEAAFVWGNKVVSDSANCEGCSQWNNDRTMPVSSFKPNAFGLYDMSGNVWEWVSDCYRPRYDAEFSADSCQEKVLRGGSWADLPPILKVANRSRAALGFSSNRIGFRLAED